MRAKSRECWTAKGRGADKPTHDRGDGSLTASPHPGQEQHFFLRRVFCETVAHELLQQFLRPSVSRIHFFEELRPTRAARPYLILNFGIVEVEKTRRWVV